MNRLLILPVLLLTLFAGTPAFSGDYQKGMTAAQSGDFATAVREWEPLAKQGDIRAQFNLGKIYFKGLGVPQDYKTAVMWYRLAAEQGYADALTNLGVMYAFGKGVLKDYVYAHVWANLAASNGNEGGAKLRDFVEKKMTPAQIAEAQKLAGECAIKNYKGC